MGERPLKRSKLKVLLIAIVQISEVNDEVVLSLKKTLFHLCRNAAEELRRNFLTHSYYIHS